MRNLRSYYSTSIAEFLQQPISEIMGTIHSNDISAETTIQQSNTWETEVQILKNQMRSFSDGRIIFEYTIPRMGKRVDVVVLYKNIVFLLEFKCGDTEYRQTTYDQVYDYALDLRNFQRESHNKLLVPIMVSTWAAAVTNEIFERERVIEPLRCNASNIADAINAVAARYDEPDLDYISWENSEYLPPPTIVEAAQALYTRCKELKSSIAKVRSQFMDRAGRSRNVEAYLQRISRTEPLTVFDESVFTGTVDCVIVRKGQGKNEKQLIFRFKDGTEIPMTI